MMVRGPNDVDARLGARLRARREGLGLSQEHIGRALGVSQAQIAKYETGDNRVPLDKVRSLAEVLETDANYLFDITPAEAVSPRAMDIARLISALPDNLQRNISAIIGAIVNGHVTA